MTDSFALHNLDIQLLDYIGYQNGFFIEAGANDGITQSNTYLLERDYNWTGLLVEPNQHKANECKSNRKNSIVENYALVSKNYQGDVIEGDFSNDTDQHLLSMVLDQGDWVDEHLMNEKNRKKYTSPIVSVPAITLTELLIKHNVEKIDLFSLDVEGYEISVLNGLDFNLFSPEYILVETTVYENRKKAIMDYLVERNYEFIKQLSCNDCLFRRK